MSAAFQRVMPESFVVWLVQRRQVLTEMITLRRQPGQVAETSRRSDDRKAKLADSMAERQYTQGTDLSLVITTAP